MSSPLPRANFLPGVTCEAEAEEALLKEPARSYITWASNSSRFPNGITLTYTNTVDRKKKSHVQLARSDLGVWMPLSVSEHRVFGSCRELLATRKYIAPDYVKDGSLADEPPVPGESSLSHVGCAHRFGCSSCASEHAPRGVRKRGPCLRDLCFPRLLLHSHASCAQYGSRARQ
jgi:hypothetical protein